MTQIDNYILDQQLGKGTFGEVYLTKKINSNNIYATKKLKKALVDDPRYVKYFNNEISILKKLFHENIIRLNDLKMTANHYYIIMEYCNGGSLLQNLNKYKELYHHAFTEEIVQYIMRQVISAVRYIHSQKIIHRDLKLDNILVNYLNKNDFDSVNLLKAKIKIIDFGFASTKEDNLLFSTAIGSPLNMDPLILRKFNAGRTQTNDLYYDEKADIWSIGALCYQMLIGNCPFDAYNMKELLDKVEEGTYKVPTNLSKEVVSFLNGMLQYDPKKRLTAENLYNHAFLTKNVSEFTPINTNMISKNVYGGQLNINIKNNDSIWRIFSDQDKLNSIPINIYSSDTPLSESLYIEDTNEQNMPGISPGPYNEDKMFINQVFQAANSTPITSTNTLQQVEASAAPSINRYANNPPGQQNQYYQNNLGMTTPLTNNYAQLQPQSQPQNKQSSNILTFQNGYFYGNESIELNDINNNIQFKEQTPNLQNDNQNIQQLQQIQQNDQYGMPYQNNNNIEANINMIKSPTVPFKGRPAYNTENISPYMNPGNINTNNINGNNFIQNQHQIKNYNPYNPNIVGIKPINQNIVQGKYMINPPPNTNTAPKKIIKVVVKEKVNRNTQQVNLNPNYGNQPGQFNISPRNQNLNQNPQIKYEKATAPIKNKLKNQFNIQRNPHLINQHNAKFRHQSPLLNQYVNINDRKYNYNNAISNSNKKKIMPVMPLPKIAVPNLRRINSGPNIFQNNINSPRNYFNYSPQRNVVQQRKGNNIITIYQQPQNKINNNLAYGTPQPNPIMAQRGYYPNPAQFTAN